MDDELPRMLGSSGASRPARANASSGAAQLAVVAAPGRPDHELSLSVISQVRSLGHYPKRKFCKTEDALAKAENKLAKQIWKMRSAGQFTAEHEAELKAMQAETDKDADQAFADALMVDIREFGRLPKLIKNPVGEQRMAEKKNARQAT